MGGDKASQVLSIRIDPDLLDAVRERAEEEGRSVSGAIVFMVREQLGSRSRARAEPRPITGWLADLAVAVPASHAAFREARAEASTKLARAVAAKARGKRGARRA
jgi:hypothetical protein